jgi:c-di-GMP-binding flagellar brake protein YcgR
VRVPDTKDEQFHPDDQVLLEIDLQGDLGKVRTAGIVRRAMLHEMGKKVTLVGIEFVGITDTDSKKLNNFIYGETLI